MSVELCQQLAGLVSEGSAPAVCVCVCWQYNTTHSIGQQQQQCLRYGQLGVSGGNHMAPHPATTPTLLEPPLLPPQIQLPTPADNNKLSTALMQAGLATISMNCMDWHWYSVLTLDSGIETSKILYQYKNCTASPHKKMCFHVILQWLAILLKIPV